MKTTLLIILGACALLPAWGQGQDRNTLSWAPKPLKPVGYFGVNRPIVRIADLLARHKGQQNWEELMVDDDHLTTRYIASAPGTKTGKRYHPQTREWWIVTDGQIRFEIEGQEPFVASQGWMVQVPPRTIYSLETVGDKPSLRYEVNIAHAQTLYPEDQKPPTVPGISWMLVKSARVPAPYDRGNKPYLIFDEVAANIEKKQARGGNRFITDDRGVANIIYGYEKNLPPEGPDEKGHRHPECAETWLIMTGQIKYKIEGQPIFVADKGDVVYAPRFMWHHATFAGPGPSCRLAMTGYPGITSLVEPKSGAAGER